MAAPESMPGQHRRRSIRWWPGLVLIALAAGAIGWIRAQADWAFQQRNLITAQVAVIAAMLLLVWWTFFSRAPNRTRLSATFGILGAFILAAALFRVRGFTGDMIPVLEFRWSQRDVLSSHPVPAARLVRAATNDFPQFLGPDRNGVLSGPRLETNWAAHPPTVIWRKAVGSAWSGFAAAGAVCLTQEQRAGNECVVAYEMETGRQLWLYSDKAHYSTATAGDGPRATPTVVSNRVFTYGATCILNCLDLATGARLWSRNLLTEGGGKIPAWGAASSPLLVDGLVVVHGGEGASHSLYAFRADDGQPVWAAGTSGSSYASPSLTTLAGVRQVLAFNDGTVSAHDPATGKTLWERRWGNGNVVCSSPVVVGEDRVLFSSGYGVGAELLEISRREGSLLTVESVWKSIRMKAKFAHMFIRDGSLFGLDDGIMASVDLKDGSQRWKEGRYGHGQGLLIGEFYLLMTEFGELILLRLTPDASNELGRFRVFDARTWNPIALAGDLLLVRNDREAACLRLKLATP